MIESLSGNQTMLLYENPGQAIDFFSDTLKFVKLFRRTVKCCMLATLSSARYSIS
jgi:hypothetical protein